MMPIEILDPTHEGSNIRFSPAPRLESLNGATVAIVSNGKKGTGLFFDAFDQTMKREFGVSCIVRLTKSNYSAPLDDILLSDIEKWQALVAGVGD